ncbi:MAG: hypothetical protein KAH54_03725 [Candidatus Sabulitectum sp.]|nr:hypothetical protein [Candidatus Sabulitectum sp.]
MKKIYLLMALMAFPVLFLACGSGEAPATDEPEEVEETEIEVVISNGLGSWDIAEIWVDPSDGAWTDNLIDEILAPGEEFTVVLEEAGSYNLWITDEDGDTYTRYGVEINQRGYEWEVTLEDMDDWGTDEVTVTIENDLGDWIIWYAYCSPSSDSEWGEDRLGTELLEQGESVSFEVMSGDYYDFMVEDEDGDVYTLLDEWVDEDGFLWVVDLSDMDNTFESEIEGSGGDATVTIHNGLGDWTIWYVYGDPSDGPWGEDRLGSELLEPGEEMSFRVHSGQDYDFKVEDGTGDTYTRWNVFVDTDGYYWEVTLSDLD